MKLREIAERLHCRLDTDSDRDGDLEIRRVAGIEQAQPGDLTFIANSKYQSQLASTRASAVIVSLTLPRTASPALLRSEQPYLAFAQALALLAPVDSPSAGIDATSVIAPDAIIGEGVSIGPLVTV